MRNDIVDAQQKSSRVHFLCLRNDEVKKGEEEEEEENPFIISSEQKRVRKEENHLCHFISNFFNLKPQIISQKTLWITHTATKVACRWAGAVKMT